MTKKRLISVNGNIVEPEQANVSVLDRGFLYGDSIYEVIHLKKRVGVFYHEHMNRLERSAALIGMKLHKDRDELWLDACKLLKAVDLEDAYLRIVITRGVGDLNLYEEPREQTLVMIAQPIPNYPDRFFSEGIFLSIAKRLRNHPKTTDPRAKSGNYLNNLLALKEARDKGADDALMENLDGNITEGTTFNIWCVSHDVLYTPPVHSGILEGITRMKIIDVCKSFDVAYKESDFNARFLLGCDEVFITSSTRGVMPVKKIDARIYDKSPLEASSTTARVSDLYNEEVLKDIRYSHYKVR